MTAARERPSRIGMTTGGAGERNISHGPPRMEAV